ncbi:hypothetical protein F4804DRAFT_320803 [Jackrogersella minutella]|nr:hypothetical protein F4804DRAFT_320803 [Jackrogersella minutella]
MRLCKALSCRSASFGQYRAIAPCLNRRYFADDRAQHEEEKQRKPQRQRRQRQQNENPEQEPTEADPNDKPLASDWEHIFQVNPEDKTVETAVGNLPLSPIMDPTFWEARRRFQTPKAKAKRAQNSVERQLKANAFAKALATPVRMCVLTRTRLPSFFLQDFNVVAHPETGVPWLIPKSLIPKGTPAAEEDPDKTMEVSGEADAKADDPQENSSEATALKNDEQLLGPSAHILARRDVLSSFVTRGSGYEAGPKRMLGASARFRQLEGKVVWRKDMDTYIRDLMRQEIVNDLLYLSKLCTEDKRHYVTKCYGWDDVQFKHKGAVLWFEHPEENRDASVAGSQPGRFATYKIDTTDTRGEPLQTSVAVHNMPLLLGPDQCDYVKKEAAALKDGSIFMLAGRRSTNLQAKLWKLQGYLADYRD